MQGIPWDLGRAIVVGVTGPPGVGKSTLVDQLLATWHARGTRVAVLAVDPSSPLTHGALLGDRVRMGRHDTSDHVMIRSVATRGAGGGVSAAVPSMIRLLAHAEFDVILVETVGVGQIELDIAGLADVTVLVMAPGLGDGIQAAKAGILEIADVFAVNKSDLPGAQQTREELERAVHMSGLSRQVLNVSATTSVGIDELLAAIDAVSTETRRTPRRRRRVGAELSALLRSDFDAALAAAMAQPEIATLLDQLVSGSIDTGDALAQISARMVHTI